MSKKFSFLITIISLYYKNQDKITEFRGTGKFWSKAGIYFKNFKLISKIILICTKTKQAKQQQSNTTQCCYCCIYDTKQCYNKINLTNKIQQQNSILNAYFNFWIQIGWYIRQNKRLGISLNQAWGSWLNYACLGEIKLYYCSTYN